MKPYSDRDLDLKWITKNVRVISAAAKNHYLAGGRGTLIFDHTADGGAPDSYFIPQGEIPNDDSQTRLMVDEYDPSAEMVVSILKPGNRMSTYRLGLPRDSALMTERARSTQRMKRNLWNHRRAS